MIGIILVTHDDIGVELLKAVRKKLGPQAPVNAQAVSVRKDDSLETSFQQISAAMKAVDQGNGVVALVDIQGATPYNLMMQALPKDPDKANFITGVNFPMLLALATTPDTVGLRDAADAAERAGRDNIGRAADIALCSRRPGLAPRGESSPIPQN